MKPLPLLIVAVSLLTPAAISVGRQWNDGSGEFSVEAEFVSFKDEEVYLKKNDGSIIAVPIDKLSYKDYDYLRTLSSERDLSEFFRNNILPSEHTVYITPELRGKCNSLDFSPDGRWLAIGTHSGLMLVDLAKSEFIPSREERGRIMLCRFTPDGKSLITGRIAGPVKVWQFDKSASLKLLREYNGHGRSLASLTFSSDGKHVLTGDEHSTLMYWNLETGEEIQSFKVSEDILAGPASACFVNPRGTQAMAASGRFLVLFDLRTGKPLQRMAVAADFYSACAISPDGTLIAVGRAHNIHCWRTVEGTKSPKLQPEVGANVMAFSPNGKYLVVGDDERACLWSMPDQKLIHTFLTAARITVRVVAFSSDSQYLAIGARNSERVQIFRIPQPSGSAGG